MNRSRYISRPADPTDRSILVALAANGRVTVRELAQSIGLSAPSVTDRIRRMEDIGVISGYTINIDQRALGMVISAHLRMRPVQGELKRVMSMLINASEIVEADRVTGEDCFYARAIVKDLVALEALVDHFLPFAATTTAVVQSSAVERRIPIL
jgi:Lrp/AsnC family transcriptional regulator, leucine-responsive regulatory protein